jgi:hypothetical protein
MRVTAPELFKALAVATECAREPSNDRCDGLQKSFPVAKAVYFREDFTDR